MHLPSKRSRGIELKLMARGNRGQCWAAIGTVGWAGPQAGSKRLPGKGDVYLQRTIWTDQYEGNVMQTARQKRHRAGLQRGSRPKE